jgi:hypothetical protein
MVPIGFIVTIQNKIGWEENKKTVPVVQDGLL